MDLLWVLLSALMLALSRLPIHCGWMVFFGWIPLLYVLERRKVKLWQAGLLFSIVYIGVVMYWIAGVTFFGLIGIAIVYFLFYWLCFYAISRIGRFYPRLFYPNFIAVMLSFEYLQNFGETRFPWFNNAYSLSDYTVLIQAGDLGGVILLSLLILLINVLLYEVLLKKKTQCLLYVAGIFILWIGYGIYCLNYLPVQKQDPKITVMQPSIPQDEKWDESAYQQILHRYDALCAQAKKDSTKLIIFPEAAMPVYLMYDYRARNYLNDLMQKYELEIFTGFPHFTLAPENHINSELYYNAAALFHPDGSISELYYKNILVPVGERMLWLNIFPFLWKLQFGQANWEFGNGPVYYQTDSLTFSPSICYELAFAEFHQQMAIRKDKTTGKLKKADFLVNITNDAWFGTSYGPWLHSIMAKFRAVENRIQIYRSANTGISLIVDPFGRIIAKAGLFEITTLQAPLYRCSRIPVYRYIYWYPWIFVILAGGLFLFSFTKKKQKGEVL